MQFLSIDRLIFSFNLLPCLFLLTLCITINRSESCLLSNISYTICSSTDANLVFESKSVFGNEFVTECDKHFIEKILDKSCSNFSIDSTQRKLLTTAKSYGYAFLAVFIISILSVLGLLAFPLLYSLSFKYFLNLFTALAIGTLFGDTMFHLIPFALGVHNHSKHDEQTHSIVSIPDYTWKMLLSVSIFYSFYLLETFLHSCSHSQYKPVDAVTHSHTSMINPKQLVGNKENLEVTAIKIDTKLENGHRLHTQMHHNFHQNTPDELNRKSTANQLNETNKSNPNVCAPYAHLHDNLPKSSIVSHGFKKCSSKTNQYKPVPVVVIHESNDSSESKNTDACIKKSNETATIGWLVLVGDTIHNFADGLAIGAAFSQDLTLGITTTFAIGLHELPHEFGDYAILIRSGFSHSRAIFLNCITGTAAFIGCLIGVTLSSNDHIRQWIFTITIGMFIYISLVDLLPTLVADSQNDLKCFILVNIGMIVGIVIMFLLALFEDSLIQSSH
ncbi:unnamed protein product [Rotaria magnacalcarata]|uniref:Uncharacterized protein n=1 Tax=Rotaria magnacalcarata TaxID=392030 RepID=A0A817A416_9BILA|nr:unnamed protein product [Rotaria magnacalcarata]CAF2243152.1 unnamed protein product [Rotaria magnacalcarata]CAF3808693.1 unnamed protein product [Rotaria magnacalcarata]CAF3816469.1 unnamed protein product [Rotaria magnacalcarata]